MKTLFTSNLSVHDIAAGIGNYLAQSGKMKSLRLFMQKKHLTHAIRSSMENFSQLENDGIDIIPLYAIANL